MAGASLAMLSSLVDKSLLRVDATGRYDLHELLRQYGEEQLDLEPVTGEATRDRHCDYYAGFMEQREPDVKGRRQLAALNEIEVDFENVRAAWLWALRQQNDAAIEQIRESLSLFCHMSNRFLDGMDLLWQAQKTFAVDTMDEPSLIWRQVFAHWLELRLWYDTVPADIEVIRTQIESNIALARQRGEQEEVAFCLWILGLMEHSAYDFASAIRPFEDSFTLYRDLEDRFAMAKAADFLAADFMLVGDRAKADHFNQLSLDLRRKLGDQFGIALVLQNIIHEMITDGRHSGLEHYLNEVDAIHLEMGNRVLRARNQVMAALYFFMRGDFDEIRPLLTSETIDILQDSWAGTKMVALDILGMVANIEEDYLTASQWYETIPGSRFPYFGQIIAAIGLGDYAEAERLWQSWLSRGPSGYSVHLQMLTLPIAALLAAHEGDQERAAELLSLVFHYPARATGWLEKWPLLSRLRVQLKTELGAEGFAAAWERGQERDFNAVTDELRAEAITDQTPIASTAAPSEQPLQDPLTNREMDVLRLLAAGHSNREIAQTLVLALGTIKWYVSEIYSKLGVSSRTQAIARARELDLLT